MSAALQKPKKKKNHIGSILFLVALMAVTFYLIFKDNSIEEIWAALKNVSPVYVGAAVIVMLSSLVFQALALGAPLDVFGCRVSLKRKLEYAFTGFYFSAITPSSTGGQPMQIYYMCRDNIHLSHVSLSMLLSNITYQLTILLYGISMYLMKFSYINTNLEGFTWLLVFGIVMNLFVALVITFMLLSSRFAKSTASATVTLLCKLHVIKDEISARKNVEKQLEEYHKGAKFIKASPWLFIKVFIFTIAQMTTLYSIPFFVYKAFGFSGQSFFDLIALQAVLYVAVSFLPLPGAMGASESGFVKLFKLFFSSAAIVPAMLISRTISFYSMLALSGIVVMFMQLRKPDKAKKRRLLLTRHRSFTRLTRSA